MKGHSISSGHQVVLSLTDFSVWCYSCDSYTNSPQIEFLVSQLESIKYPPNKPLENVLESIPAGDALRPGDLEKELEAAKNARIIDGMYAVTPKDDCPHVNELNLAADYSIFHNIKVDSICTDCDNTSENWVCLKCGIVKCSRYVNEHMLMHALESTHALALSFSDLSFWCYHCESYIVDLDLSEIYNLFSHKKFGKAKPNAYNSTAHVSEEEKIEYFDTEEELDAKVKTLAQWIRESNHFMAFTGAGISTSAGIPDYRSGFNTVLPTGAGCWERKSAKNNKAPKPSLRNAITKAIPTPTHMAFVKLVESGYLKYMLSQNVDGLHRKSGIPVEKLAELHGNANVEKCKKCGMEYMRDFGVRNNPHVHMHETGNLCDDFSCGGELIDTIVNFGENLDSEVLEKTSENTNRSDLCLAMGSSLRVNPAALFPKTVASNGRLVIVNLQKTPLDKVALCIHAMCDVVMQKLMNELGLEIPEFRLKRRVGVRRNCGKIIVRGLDFNGAPYSILTKVLFRGSNQIELKKEPFFIDASEVFNEIVLSFQGHYGEPEYCIRANSQEITEIEQIHELVYDPFAGLWV